MEDILPCPYRSVFDICALFEFKFFFFDSQDISYIVKKTVKKGRMRYVKVIAVGGLCVICELLAR